MIILYIKVGIFGCYGNFVVLFVGEEFRLDDGVVVFWLFFV